jgi:hypothetical protein
MSSYKIKTVTKVGVRILVTLHTDESGVPPHVILLAPSGATVEDVTKLAQEKIKSMQSRSKKPHNNPTMDTHEVDDSQLTPHIGKVIF